MVLTRMESIDNSKSFILDETSSLRMNLLSSFNNVFVLVKFAIETFTRPLSSVKPVNFFSNKETYLRSVKGSFLGSNN